VDEQLDALTEKTLDVQIKNENIGEGDASTSTKMVEKAPSALSKAAEKIANDDIRMKQKDFLH
jgi:hypothetical protein